MYIYVYVYKYILMDTNSKLHISRITHFLPYFSSSKHIHIQVHTETHTYTNTQIYRYNNLHKDRNTHKYRKLIVGKNIQAHKHLSDIPLDNYIQRLSNNHTEKLPPVLRYTHTIA